MIEAKVKENGGEYVGDLSKSVTHLITHKPEGKKYTAALRWGIQPVSIEWLHDSVERGMILDESCYYPTLPPEKRGVGAWTRKEVRRESTGKRLREDGASTAALHKRKLRKTASMKLTSQNENLWGDILNQHSPATSLIIAPDDQAADTSIISVDEPVVLQPESVPRISEILPVNNVPEGSERGVFAGCRFLVHGFPPAKTDIVCEHLTSHGGLISTSVDDVASPRHPEPTGRRFLIVPQTSQPDSYPQLPPEGEGERESEGVGVHVVTEFYLERCIHGRRLCDPAEHVLGRPFPQFPVEGFAGLVICTTGFRDEQLNQVEKAVVQLGARYAESFNARASLLVSPSLDRVRGPKREFARSLGIPLVDAEWLWRCIATGSLVPWGEHLLQELGGDSGAKGQQQRRKLHKVASEPVLRKPKRVSPAREWFDRSVFRDDDGPAAPRTAGEPAVSRQKQADESSYETAPTHAVEDTEPTTVLREASTNALNNKSPLSPQRQKKQQPDRQLKRFPTGGTVADSDADDNSQALSFAIPAPALTPATDAEAEAAAAARKRHLLREEREKQEKAAREKKEMSRRLNSLMMASHGNHSSNNGCSNGEDSPVIGGGGGGGGSVAAQQRRKREVLGRAISNVSAASSNGSADSSSLGPTAVTTTAATTATNGGKAVTGAADEVSFASAASGGSGGGGGLQHLLFDKMLDPAAEEQAGARQQQQQHDHDQDHGRDDGGDREQQQPRPPPATQLQYDNPEAREHRAAVMDRILRKKGGGVEKKGGGAVDRGDRAGRRQQRQSGQQEELTFADLEAAGLGGGGEGGVAAISTTRRATRRQKGF